MIRVLLADDHAIVRRGLIAVLGAESEVEVIGEAATPQEAVLLARSTAPDVVLLDLQFGVGQKRGTDVIPALRQASSQPAVLVLTTYDNDQDVTAAMDAGAAGYLLKDSPAEELVAAVQRARSGAGAVDPRISQRLRERQADTTLSAREMEVLTRVAAGRTNAQIASDLFLSQATVKTHLVHVFDKLGVTSRTEAVARARARGILRPE
ncbi:response regulator [Brachybacterium fresconis]|uniref:DNA-binding NarL/FixJ family response regulator n=1 Tax=Brachybacterium fresconis TaxID=173363 RepID=A0ABS4YFF5_9MICO|nr:response regulator transcription factor [Brachybacterium fresconis]MBP2407523.1 DNA-binding NarL/FixJ family response regulator [Brachybacterium fresconis]